MEFSTRSSRVLKNVNGIRNGTKNKILWQKSFRLEKSRDER